MANFLNQSDIINGYISSGDEADYIDSDVDYGDDDISDGAIIGSDDEEFDDDESADEEPPVRRPTTNDVPAPDITHDFIRGLDLNPTRIPFSGKPGINIRNVAGLTPFGYLQLFLTSTIIDTIVTETNRFASESPRSENWENLAAKDMW